MTSIHAYGRILLPDAGAISTAPRAAVVEQGPAPLQALVHVMCLRTTALMQFF